MSTSAATLASKVRKQRPHRRRAERLAVEERRNQLLELGIEIVGQRRYEEPWLEEVARTANISKGLIYHYFDTKRGYYVAILRHIAQGLADTWTDTVSPLIDKGAPGEEMMQAGLDAYLDYACAYPAAFRTLFQAGAGIDPEVGEVDTYLREQVIGHIARFLGTEDLPLSQRAGLTGWIAFSEQVCMDWLENDSLARKDVREMMGAVLVALFSSPRARSSDKA